MKKNVFFPVILLVVTFFLGCTLGNSDEDKKNNDKPDEPTELSKVTLYFTSFNSQESTLEVDGFRVYGYGDASLDVDVEPEYITVSDDSLTAWVTLQENNGIAKISLSGTPQITDIFPLGFKDYSSGDNKIDANDKDELSGTDKRSNYDNLYGMYQPDAIAHYEYNGLTYLLTANEGEAREWGPFIDEARVKDITLDPIAFPNAEDLQENGMIGRLNVTTNIFSSTAVTTHDKLYTFGARSFSVWNGTNGALIWDSGVDTEQRAVDAGTYDDGRSDNKGAEPEGITVGTVGDKVFAFVGLERADAVLIYDITNPVNPVYSQTLTHPDNSDDAPEGLLFIPAVNSPSSNPLLIVSNEESATVSIWESNSSGVFAHKSTIQLDGGVGAAEISAYCKTTKKLFVVNNGIDNLASQIDIIDLTNIDSPTVLSPIVTTDYGTNINSVAIRNGLLAVALEGANKTDTGKAVLFKTSDSSFVGQIGTGAQPDMITFSPDGKFILTADEGEPSDDYSIDPKGSITVIRIPSSFYSN